MRQHRARQQHRLNESKKDRATRVRALEREECPDPARVPEQDNDKSQVGGVYSKTWSNKDEILKSYFSWQQNSVMLLSVLWCYWQLSYPPTSSARMAFEDRFSPDTAKSPNSASEVQQNSPESSRTSAYTCQIINHNYLSAKKEDLYSTNLKQNEETKPFFRITSYALDKEESSSSNEDSTSLKYSIHNILQPNFGKNAILQTKTKPSKIGFKPYEKPAPLGSLCQTVSQIGKTNVCEVKEKKEEIKKDEVKETEKDNSDIPTLWPAWVYCTRYSDRPSSGKNLLFCYTFLWPVS